MAKEPYSDHASALADAAEHFYDAEELYEDEDLDPDDHVAVLVRAFTSGACDDFAYVVHLMTGWPTVRATWTVPDVGAGHHTLVRNPGGRLLDAAGWVDEAAIRRRYLGRRRGVAITITDALPLSSSIYDDEDLQRIAGVIRALPGEPFCDAQFRQMSTQPVSDPDLAGDEVMSSSPAPR